MKTEFHIIAHHEHLTMLPDWTIFIFIFGSEEYQLDSEDYKQKREAALRNYGVTWMTYKPNNGSLDYLTVYFDTLENMNWFQVNYL